MWKCFLYMQNIKNIFLKFAMVCVQYQTGLARNVSASRKSILPDVVSASIQLYENYLTIALLNNCQNRSASILTRKKNFLTNIWGISNCNKKSYHFMAWAVQSATGIMKGNYRRFRIVLQHLACSIRWIALIRQINVRSAPPWNWAHNQ